MKRIEPEQIQEEMASFSKPTAYENQSFPYNDLDDRQFEILLYQLFKERIKKGEYSEKFDDVYLMQGIHEKGRDCILVWKGLYVGLIQCKKYKNRLTRNQVGKEIIKFILYYLKHNSLISDLNNYTYFFAVSYDFAEEAINLFNELNRNDFNEIEIKSWTKQNIKLYKNLQDLKLEAIIGDIFKVLKKIEFSKIISADLNLWLNPFPNLISLFFKVRTVVLINDVKKELTNLLNLPQTEFFREFGDFKYEIILKDNIVKPFRPDGPHIGDFKAIRQEDDWIYIPSLVKKLFKKVHSGEMVILVGKSATGKSIMVRFLGFNAMKKFENEVFYIDFINTDKKDKEIFLENLEKLVKHPTFETLKIEEKSPLFILENIHDSELEHLKIGRKSLIKSLKALEGKIKLIITSREDLSKSLDLNWVRRRNIINLNQNPDLNKEIINGMLKKINVIDLNIFFSEINWKLKDGIENLWLLGLFLRFIIKMDPNSSSIEGGIRHYLRNAIKEYYNIHNFPCNHKFLPENILTILLIISVTSKYEVYMEKNFIVKSVIQYFHDFKEKDVEEILQLLVDNHEILISKEHLTAKFEYRIPHIKLAEILQIYYANDLITSNLLKIFREYLEFGENVLDLGYSLGLIGEYENAIICFKKVLSIDSKKAGVWESLGVTYGRNDQYDESIEAFRKAIELDSNQVNSWYCLGLSFYRKSYYDEAINAFNKAIEIDSKLTDAWVNLGLALVGKNQYDSAIESYKKAIEINQNHNNAWLNLGSVYINNHQYDEAIEAWKKAIDLDKNDSDAWYNLGTAYYEIDEYKEAIKAFQTAIKIKPDKIYA